MNDGNRDRNQMPICLAPSIKLTFYNISTADVEEVIYDKVGRTPQILNEK